MNSTLLRVLIGVLLSTAVVSAAEGDLPLISAARSGDLAVARRLVQQGAVVNARQADGATALHWAAHRDDLELVDVLIGARADVNAANDLGATPLWVASNNASAAMVEKLLKAGANPNAALRSGETSIMTASRAGKIEAVRVLISHGANVNAKERRRDQTALMWAVAQQHPDVVKLLLQGGADVRARARAFRYFANTTGQLNGEGLTEVDLGGSTPLLFAARYGNVDSARHLLDAGADVNELAPSGATALVVAAHSGHGTLGASLLERGADPNAIGAGYTALHAAILRSDLALAEALLARGADPDAILEQPTPARRQSSDYQLPPDVVGATPLWIAARFGEFDIMRLLVAKGADVKFEKDGATVLMLVISPSDRAGRLSGYGPPAPPAPVHSEPVILEAARTFVERGVPLDAADEEGNTAMHAAAARGHDTVVRFLAEQGAKVDAKNRRGQTPMQLAATARGGSGAAAVGRASTVELLRQLGAKE